MTQQRTFREHEMPQFGRDLIWATTALLLYGVVGQIFVRKTALFPSTFINSELFLQWFGVPVQLFRGVMAAMLAVFMIRALNAFDIENDRRLEAANQARLDAQANALETERRISRERQRLNAELRQTARELALLLELSNLLARPLALQDRLDGVLQRLLHTLGLCRRRIDPAAGTQQRRDRRARCRWVRCSAGRAGRGPEQRLAATG